MASHNLNLVSLADWHGTNVVLGDEVLGKMGGHHNSADAAGGGKVRLS